jgi:branched-subunit amino acid transport protein
MTTTTRSLLIVTGMALSVYLPKLLPLLLVGDRLPAGLRRWLQYVAPAVLSALVAPAILAPEGSLAKPSWEQSPFLVTLLIAVATRRMFVAVAGGVATLLLLTFVGR